eukprot:449653-Pelagomonas_calceolata.AAC.2
MPRVLGADSTGSTDAKGMPPLLLLTRVGDPSARAAALVVAASAACREVAEAASGCSSFSCACSARISASRSASRSCSWCTCAQACTHSTHKSSPSSNCHQPYSTGAHRQEGWQDGGGLLLAKLGALLGQRD